FVNKNIFLRRLLNPLVLCITMCHLCCVLVDGCLSESVVLLLIFSDVAVAVIWFLMFCVVCYIFGWFSFDIIVAISSCNVSESDHGKVLLNCSFVIKFSVV